jgi:streptogramin lyase
MAKRLTRITLLCTLVFAALAYVALPASAHLLGYVRYIPSALVAEGLAAGPEGEMWATADEAAARITTGEPPLLTLLSAPDTWLGRIVAGSDGNMWFARNGLDVTEIGRITPGGEITEFNSGAAHRPRWMTLGPEGDVWYTAGIPGAKHVGEKYESSAIGRITPSGQVSEFTAGLTPQPHLEQITTGPDGDLWFVNDGSPYTIGRITPAGEIKEFTISENPELRPSGITAGANGNVYFGASGENNKAELEDLIMEITPAGEVTVATRLNYSEAIELATGPEGAIWFTGKSTEPVNHPNVIGRLTPQGHLEEKLTNLGTETEARLITPGPDGNMWFIAVGEGSRQIGVIETGEAGASQAPPVVTGVDQAGSELSCAVAAWSTWAGQQPSASVYGFDGYTWMLGGVPIAGQRGQSLLTTEADVGHQISCSVTATYRLLNVTVDSAASAGVSISAAPLTTTGTPLSASTGPPSALAKSVLTVPLQGDTVTRHGGVHVAVDCTGAPCSGTVKLIYKLKITVGRGKHKRIKTLPITIASGSFASLPVGVDRVVLELAGHGLQLLSSHKYRLGANVSVSYIATGVSRASAKGAILLEGTKPKFKHKSG